MVLLVPGCWLPATAGSSGPSPAPGLARVIVNCSLPLAVLRVAVTGDPAAQKGSGRLAHGPSRGQCTQYTTVLSSTQEEEDLALARALSASEAEYQQSQRQVSGAGCRLCTVVGLILTWHMLWRGSPWVLLLLGPA